MAAYWSNCRFRDEGLPLFNSLVRVRGEAMNSRLRNLASRKSFYRVVHNTFRYIETFSITSVYQRALKVKRSASCATKNNRNVAEIIYIMHTPVLA